MLIYTYIAFICENYAKGVDFMALDGGMLACVAHELHKKLLGGRVEKVLQPERDEIHLLIHAGKENHRLMLSASSGTPRVSITAVTKENPPTPPMFCMLLRKHLTGARLRAVEQPAFERILSFSFDTKEEMGEYGTRTLIIELMGRYANLILCSTDMRVLGALRYSDLSDTTLRPLLPGIAYTLPPDQGKSNPLELTKDRFLSDFSAFSPETDADKALFSLYRGFSPAVCTELCHLADVTKASDASRLWEVFSSHIDRFRLGNYSPTIHLRANDGVPFAYSYIPLTHFGDKAKFVTYQSPGALLDDYHVNRETEQRRAQRAADLTRLLKNAQNRLQKKITLQEEELADTASADLCKKSGELIFQELHRIKKGDTSLTATDYETGEKVTVKLDPRYPPAVNANKYFKDYNRKKTAKTKLAEQLDRARSELRYVDTVRDALSRAKTESDILQIREELNGWEYGGKRKKNHSKQKVRPHPPIQLTTPGGFTLLVGKNNLQNDLLTTKLASKNDWWFHVKDYPGSHVVMITGEVEPPAEDFTFAAKTAASHSSADAGAKIAVDYTRIRHVKKPAGARPGFVIYDPYWTAYVTKGEKD